MVQKGYTWSTFVAVNSASNRLWMVARCDATHSLLLLPSSQTAIKLYFYSTEFGQFGQDKDYRITINLERRLELGESYRICRLEHFKNSLFHDF